MRKLLLLPFFLFGCVQATVSDTVSETVDITYPLPPIPAGLSNFSLPPTQLPTQSQSVDISDAISQVEKIGTPSLTITQNHLHSNMGDFTFLDAIEVSATSSDSSTSQELINITLTPDQKNSTDLDIPVLVDSNTLIKVFSGGPASLNFTFTVEGQPPASNTLSVSATIGLDVSLAINKSINDIGK